MITIIPRLGQEMKIALPVLNSIVWSRARFVSIELLDGDIMSVCGKVTVRQGVRDYVRVSTRVGVIGVRPMEIGSIFLSGAWYLVVSYSSDVGFQASMLPLGTYLTELELPE